MKKKIILNFAVSTLAVLSIIMIVIGIKVTQAINENLIKDQRIINKEAGRAVTEKINRTWDMLNLISKDNAIFNVSENTTQMVNTLNEFKNKTDFLSIGYIDKEGHLLRYDGVTVDVKDREYFQEAIKGNNYVSSPQMSKTTNDLVVFYSVPIKNNGEVTGVVVSSVHAEQLVNLVDEIKIGNTGYCIILGAKGNYISHIDKSLISEKTNALEVTKEKRLLELFKDAVSGNTGQGEYDFNGKEKFMSYAPISNTNWSMIVTIDKNETHAGIKSVYLIFIILGIGGIILTVVLSFFIGTSIAKPITRLSVIAERISEGDFTAIVDNNLLNRKDELGILSKAFYSVNNNLSLLLGDVRDTLLNVEDVTKGIEINLESIKVGAEETSKTVEAVAVGAQEQANNTEQGVVSSDELGKTIEKVYGTVSTTSLSTKAMNKEASDGLTLVVDLINQTNEVQSSMNKVQIAIKETNESSNNIGEASKVISDISQQTNLLALNAAIEAARAGEAGKGFAVVADEIRKLSEQSNESTNDINKSLEELQNNSRVSVETIEVLLKVVKEQMNLVKKTEDKYNNIAGVIENVAKQMENISDETANIEDMKNKMIDILQNLSAIAEENAASTEETLAISEDQKITAVSTAEQSSLLTEQVRELQARVNKFKLN